MKIAVRDTLQTMHRVKVGLVGLASVVVLIGMAAMAFAIVNRERPGVAVGAPKVDVAANLAAGNTATPSDPATGDPLVQLGVAPATTPSPAKK